MSIIRPTDRAETQQHLSQKASKETIPNTGKTYSDFGGLSTLCHGDMFVFATVLRLGVGLVWYYVIAHDNQTKHKIPDQSTLFFSIRKSSSIRTSSSSTLLSLVKGHRS